MKVLEWNDVLRKKKRLVQNGGLSRERIGEVSVVGREDHRGRVAMEAMDKEGERCRRKR